MKAKDAELTKEAAALLDNYQPSFMLAGLAIGRAEPAINGQADPIDERASWLARKAMASATSSASAARPRGMRSRNLAMSASLRNISSVNSLRVKLGHTAFTLTPPHQNPLPARGKIANGSFAAL
jgi:hypothetical protein